MLRSFLHVVVKLLFRVISRLHVEGQENIPGQGAALLASNHLNLLDAPLVFAAVDRKDLIPLVGDSHRKTWWIRMLVDAVNGIWIKRGGADLHALRASCEHLEHGGALGIAPEGTRSRTGALIPAKTGAAYLADRANVLVVPVAIWGTEAIASQLSHLHRPEIHIQFGEAFLLPPISRGDRDAALQANTNEIMHRIAVMLPVKYRGVYQEALTPQKV